MGCSRIYCRSQTAEAACAAVEVLRGRRYTGKQIAAEVGISPATVSRISRRLGPQCVYSDLTLDAINRAAPSMKKFIKIAGYCRLSTTEQAADITAQSG
jgi:DNA-binding MurR/RpiR family transcriptional regulator